MKRRETLDLRADQRRCGIADADEISACASFVVDSSDITTQNHITSDLSG
jgi:hypothetical protein